MPTDRPANVVVVLADDLGYSDLGAFGGEIRTPNLDALARDGVRMTSFYNTARCSPSRASLLTGRDPHETGIGVLTDDERPHGYPGSLSTAVPTVAEHLSAAGYRTCLSGKWHLSSDTATPNDTWPTRRGFDEFYGILAGADDYFHPRGLFHGEQRQEIPGEGFYLTDAISDHAVRFVETCTRGSDPFFLYLAYTAPHWPLHAPEDVVRRYERQYLAGWDTLRDGRLARMRELGLLGDESPLTPRDAGERPWNAVPDREWEARRMAVYAAQIEIMDAGIGRVVEALRAADALDDTLIVFLSDNGGCAEELPPPDAVHFRARQPAHTPDGRPMRLGNEPSIVPGPADTFASYGRAWANLSNSPFRLYKRWVHEGGISTPLIAHWPAGGLAGGTVVSRPFQLTDIAPTLAEVAGTGPLESRGESMVDTWRGGPTDEDRTLYWEHIGNAAIRHGSLKLVRTAGGPWELYDLDVDRSELHDLAPGRPDDVERLAARWQAWADRTGVIPWPYSPAASRTTTNSEGR
ncbi:arylsulfatase [Saccharomonospora sp. NPDC046836]|uniref:arylsulfatase n=1 Tax=Saccharomonospora sp. NPDC046836 TaxID=3156921 RepID=UPI00340648CC